MSTQMGERNRNLDILRVTACVLVVLSHVSSGAALLPAGTFEWSVQHVFNTLGHTGTILFLFLSGCLLLSKDYSFVPGRFYRKNFLRLFAAYYFWIIIYHMVGFLTRGNFSVRHMKDVVINIIKGEASFHFWYVPMLLGIYLILPFLRVICEKSRRLPVYFTVLFLVCKVLFDTILLFEFPYKYLVESVLTRIPFTLVNHYAGYFVMGTVLYEALQERKKKNRIIGPALIAVGAVGSLVGDMVLSRQQGETALGFNTLFSATLCLCAVGIFLVVLRLADGAAGSGTACSGTVCRGVANHGEKGQKKTAFLRTLSGLSFGVYMIHPLMMNLVEEIMPTGGVYAWWSILPMTALVYGLSLGCAWLLSLIPAVKKWVLFV